MTSPETRPAHGKAWHGFHFTNPEREARLRNTKTIRVRELPEIGAAEAARRYRLEQAEGLLAESGWFMHSDGQWYDHPEVADDE